MRSHKTIISEAGGAQGLHDKLGLVGKVHTVRSWAQRGSIPADHWPLIVQLRLATFDELTGTKPPRKNRESQTAAAA